MDKSIQNFLSAFILSLLEDKKIRAALFQIYSEGAIELIEELKRREAEGKRVTIEEAAAYYGKSKPTIHSWVKSSNGKIKKYRPHQNSNSVTLKISEIEASLIATGYYKKPKI
jgi:hypothetical protein